MACNGFVYFEGYQLETQFVQSKFESVQHGQLSRIPLGAIYAYEGNRSGMTIIPFDVNDNKLREIFFNQNLADCITCLTENTASVWGKMNSQNMIEHLLWAFECSTGTIVLPCCTPEHLLQRVKTFLYDNRPTPHDFRNPLLGENPPPLRFHSFYNAKNALLKEIYHFVIHFREQPNALHVHPVFGLLGAEEWQRSHFKHCYHHLQQFGAVLL